MSSRVRRGLAVLLALIHLNGCSTWRPVAVHPAQLAGTDVASPLRITRQDGERVVLRNPVARADSIVGDQASVAITGIQLIEARRFSATRTLILIASVPLLFYGVLFGVCAAAQGNGCRFE